MLGIISRVKKGNNKLRFSQPLLEQEKAALGPAAQGEGYTMKFYFTLIIKIITVEVVLIPSLAAQTFKIAGSTPGAAVNLF